MVCALFLWVDFFLPASAWGILRCGEWCFPLLLAGVIFNTHAVVGGSVGSAPHLNGAADAAWMAGLMPLGGALRA